MVKGLQAFREHFREHQDAFVVIGGVACDEWLGQQGLTFRPTKDVDMVLVLEALTASFVERFWAFIKAGGYDNRQRSTGRRVYYRFSKPTAEDVPALIEVFSRQPDGIDLAAGQTIVPIPLDEQLSSLSAILMEDDYYALVRQTRSLSGDLPILTATGLIPLKARAWIDLTQRKALGEKVDEDDIRKHRRDVFRLAAALPGGVGPDIPPVVREDLRRFLASFPADASVWKDLSASLKTDLGAALPSPEALVSAIAQHFQVPPG